MFSRPAVGPDLVTVDGPRQARGGDTVRLTCATSGSNPPANITWVINGRTMMNVSPAALGSQPPAESTAALRAVPLMAAVKNSGVVDRGPVRHSDCMNVDR